MAYGSMVGGMMAKLGKKTASGKKKKAGAIGSLLKAGPGGLRKKASGKLVRSGATKLGKTAGRGARKKAAHRSVRDSRLGLLRDTARPKSKKGLRKRARRAIKAGSSVTSVRRRAKAIQRGR